MRRRKEEALTIDWLVSRAGRGWSREGQAIDMQMGMLMELSALKRQSSDLYHSVLRGHTKERKSQEKEQRKRMSRYFQGEEK